MTKSEKLREINSRYAARQMSELRAENTKLKNMLKDLINEVETAKEQLKLKKLSQAKALLDKSIEDDEDDIIPVKKEKVVEKTETIEEVKK